MTKLLFVINNADFFLSHRLPVALAAKKAGYEVMVAAPSSAAKATVERHGLSFYAIPLSRSKMNPWQDSRTLWALIKLYRQWKPDIVHHVTMKPMLYGSIAARLCRVPAVVNAVSGMGFLFISRSLRVRLIRQLVLLGLRWGFSHPKQTVIFQNQDDQQLFLKNHLCSSKQSVLIKGSGVDLSQFVPISERDDAVPTIVLPARLLKDKGVLEFVAAAREIKRRNMAARFVLAGEIDLGNPASLSHEQVRAWQAEGAVECLGWQTDMLPVFQQAQIICLPSYREGLPKALIEAAACGKPIVTTDAVGCRETVRDGWNGYCVPVGDVMLLAERLIQLIESKTLRESMGHRSRQLAEAEFGIEQVVEKTLEIYSH